MKLWKYIFGLMVLAAVATWLAVLTFPDPKLHLIACSVGEGDALLAEVGTVQILIDGGPDNKVLDCLSRHMPFWDREIELVMNTHPERDHYGGLVEVFRRYKVDNFLANSVDSGDEGYQVLKNLVGGSGAKVASPTTGSVVRIGLIQLDIFWPSEKFLAENTEDVTGRDLNTNNSVLGAYTTSRSLNDFCIASKLSFGGFSVMLACDLQPPVINQTVSPLHSAFGGATEVQASVLKVPHHGSKNGLTKEFLNAVSPQMAVISVGKNQWGHPNVETLKILSDEDIKTLRTDQKGDIEVVTDGKSWKIK